MCVCVRVSAGKIVIKYERTGNGKLKVNFETGSSANMQLYLYVCVCRFPVYV